MCFGPSAAEKEAARAQTALANEQKAAAEAAKAQEQARVSEQKQSSLEAALQGRTIRGAQRGGAVVRNPRAGNGRKPHACGTRTGTCEPPGAGNRGCIAAGPCG